MKMPNGHLAVVDRAKLREYCLNPEHPQGKHKARVFKSQLGISIEHVEELYAVLKAAALKEDAVAGVLDHFGQRYVIDFAWQVKSRCAQLRSSWIIEHRKTVPRLITCYIL